MKGSRVGGTEVTPRKPLIQLFFTVTGMIISMLKHLWPSLKPASEEEGYFALKAFVVQT